MDSESLDAFGFEYCKKCQTRVVDKSDNPDSILCKQCREELIRYPIPKWIYYFAAFIAVLMIISFVCLPGSLEPYRVIEGAEKKANEGYIYSTLNDLDVLAEQYQDSNRVPILLVDIAMEHGYYDYAAYAINTYIAGKEVSDSEYNRLESYSAVLDRYYNTYDAYDVMLSEAPDASDETVADVIAQLDALLDNPEYDPATIYYYMGYTSLDDATRCEYFEICYQLDPTYTDAAAQAANSYRRAGNLEKARELVESAYDEDKEAPAALRSLAVIEMLDGNSKKGLTLAEEAYQLNRDEYYVSDTYIVALVVNGSMEEAQELKDSLEEEGYEFDDDLRKFLDGEMTLEEYYIE